MISKLRQFFLDRPFLIVLIVLLGCISVVNLKPNFYLLGWDNYSSYFFPKENIFRTFFSTWRDWRGLGVASDSEVVDLFRQLFSFFLGLLLPLKYLDQLYYIFCLWVGSLGMYVFVARVLRQMRHGENQFVIDFGGATGAIFYLFNLNTLATFYFPIVTYVSRYALLPGLFMIIHSILHEKQVSAKFWILSWCFLLFFSGSFITATVFIATCMALGIFIFFQGQWKRIIPVLVLLFTVNAFWLLPFINYAKEKSSVIRLAPNFIEANETQLNKPTSYYDINHQLLLYPNFFDTAYLNTQNQKTTFFHPLRELWNEPMIQGVLWIFPILYIIGSIIIILQFRRSRVLLWIPLTILVFVFLSMKEYSPLGWLYDFFNTRSPLFGVLFRFGDTKFHPYIAFAGSVASAVSVIAIGGLFKKLLKHVSIRACIVGVFVLLVGPLSWSYRWYFQGNLVGFFAYTSFPTVYQDIAEIINKDDHFGRVLQLPYDANAYWRSYGWGAIGSSFFHYLINKPFIDKTFEPASMENAYVLSRISTSFARFKDVIDQTEKKRLTVELAKLFKQIGISYIVVDETISSNEPVRGVSYWGNFDRFGVRMLADEFISQGYARSLYKGNVDFSDIQKQYLGKTISNLSDKFGSIELVQLTAEPSFVSFLKRVSLVDASENTAFQDGIDEVIGPYMQVSNSRDFFAFPLRRPDGRVIPGEKNSFNLVYSTKYSDASAVLHVDSGSQDGLLRVGVTDVGDRLIFSFDKMVTPIINGQSLVVQVGSREVKKTRIGNAENFSGLRLHIGGSVLTLPSSIPPGTLVDLGVVFVTENPIISLYSSFGVKSLDLSSVKLTDKPNCFGDASPQYQSKLERTNGITLTSFGGSSCLVGSLREVFDNSFPYAELAIDLSGSQKDTEPMKPTELLQQSIATFKKPNTITVCIRESDSDLCINNRQIFNADGAKKIIIPLDNLKGILSPIMLFAAQPVNEQEQSIKLSHLGLEVFRSVYESTLAMPAQNSYDLPLDTKKDVRFVLTIPKTNGPSSYDFQHQIDSYRVFNKPCEKPDGYRSFRLINEQLLSFISGCYNEWQTELPYDNNSFLWWGVGYNLSSGKYPMFYLKDKYSTLVDQFVSLYQGYPDIIENKSLQVPPRRNGNIIDVLGSAKMVYGSIFIPPRLGAADNRSKQFIIHQDSENEGIVQTGSMTVRELPSDWRNAWVQVGSPVRDYALGVVKSINKIIPSLWKITVSAPSGDKKLLNINIGFDRQWSLYRHWSDLMSPFSSGLAPYRCDGFSLCFETPPDGGDGDYFLFYTPERLAILGWIFTLATGCIFFIQLVKRLWWVSK